jgi:hypothetical protein
MRSWTHQVRPVWFLWYSSLSKSGQTLHRTQCPSNVFQFTAKASFHEWTCRTCSRCSLAALLGVTPRAVRLEDQLHFETGKPAVGKAGSLGGLAGAVMTMLTTWMTAAPNGQCLHVVVYDYT